MDISKLIVKKKCLSVTLNCDFWNRKKVKCKINIKNTKPTPRSITHKKPIKISASFKNDNPPINNKYKPPV